MLKQDDVQYEVEALFQTLIVEKINPSVKTVQCKVDDLQKVVDEDDEALLQKANAILNTVVQSENARKRAENIVNDALADQKESSKAQMQEINRLKFALSGVYGNIDTLTKSMTSNEEAHQAQVKEQTAQIMASIDKHGENTTKKQKQMKEALQKAEEKHTKEQQAVTQHINEVQQAVMQQGQAIHTDIGQITPRLTQMQAQLQGFSDKLDCFEQQMLEAQQMAWQAVPSKEDMQHERTQLEQYVAAQVPSRQEQADSRAQIKRFFYVSIGANIVTIGGLIALFLAQLG